MTQIADKKRAIRHSKAWGSVSLLSIIAMQTSAHAQQAPTPVPDVSVNAPTTVPMDGSAAAGYRVKDTTGSGAFWGDLPIQDAPYTIIVVPSELIKNQQTYNLYDALKYVPGVQVTGGLQNGTGLTTTNVRGFNTPPFPDQSATFEGLVASGGFQFTAVEDKERIEVLEGVNGFLYGVNQIGGNINTVLKRPTATPYFAMDAGTNTGHNGYIHGDFGGPLVIPGLADGLFGYRLNVVGQDGDTQINGQSIKRNLVSAAIDVHLPYDLLVQFNASHANYHIWGITPSAGGVVTGSAFGTSPIPPADPSTVRTFPWETHSDETDIAGVKVTWKLNDIFTVRSQYEFTRESVTPNLTTFNSISTTGLETESDITDSSIHNDTTYYTHSGYAFLDTNFSIYGVQNKVTTGFNGYWVGDNFGGSRTVAPSASVTCNFYLQSVCNFPNPNVYLVPGASSTSGGAGYFGAVYFNKNYMIGDEIKAFDDKLIILAGANYAFNGFDFFNPNGTSSSHLNSSAITPAVAVTYKIAPWLSAYASYQQSLQPGQLVVSSGSTVYTNNGAELPPYVGTQHEAGLKATVGTNMLATLDVFNLDTANIYTQQNPGGTFTLLEGGSQVTKGIEFKVTGKLWEDLALFGGVTLQDPRIRNNPATPAQNGQLAQLASPVDGKIYAEYTVPFIGSAPWLHGLTLTGGLSYFSPFNGTVPTANTLAAIAGIQKYPGYTVGDLGFRYATQLYNHPLTLRFTVTNVANYGYYFGPGYEGLPRTFLASAEMKW